jgi:hypothetical protein
MLRTDRKPPSGNVGVDEFFVGGREHGATRDCGARKCVVVVAVEIGGRIRRSNVPDTLAKSLMPFVREVAEPGSVILTDGWGGPLPTHRYIK